MLKNFGRLTAGIISLLIILGVIGSLNGKKDSNTQQVPNPSSQTTQAAQASPSPSGDLITLSKSVYKDTGYGYYEVDGEATNNDSVEHTLNVKATFYDASGGILGTAIGTVSQLAPKDTKTFTLAGNDKVAGYASMKVQVDTLL